MAPRLKRRRPPPVGFPSWAEFIAITLLVVWLVGVVALDAFDARLHLLLVIAFGVLAFSFWNSRSPRGDS